MDQYCCEKCFSDLEIISFIKVDGQLGTCSHCRSHQVQIRNLEDVGRFIREGFHRAYEHVSDGTGAMWDSEDKVHIGAQGGAAGESLFDILYENLHIFSDLHTRESAANLTEQLMDESGLSDSDKKDGETDDLEEIHSDQFVIRDDLYGVESTSEHTAWETFKHTTKYYNRFFDMGDKQSSREMLLNSLEEMFKLMESSIDEGLMLYRARKFELKEGQHLADLNHYREIAPAPAKYAVTNRMSPAGISYTYIATETATCLAEIRAESGQNVLIGSLLPRRKLRIVNLSATPQIPDVSIFSKNYRHDWNWIRDFIREFRSEISKPISDGEKDMEYVGTQVLSEYIRKLGYDGIQFESSLVKGTYNYVFFCGPNPELCRELYSYTYFRYMEKQLDYFTSWFELKRLQYITVSLSSNVLEELTNVPDLDEGPLFPDGRKEFRSITEVKRALHDLQVAIEAEYECDVTLEDELRTFMKKQEDTATSYTIFVQRNFCWIEVSIWAEGPNDKDEISFTFSHRDRGQLEDQLLGK